MTFLKRNHLLLIVFITGACVLIIELTAFRILSPFFGNTIFTASAIISTVLGALSLGYYFGGSLADRRGELLEFYKIIVLSGVSIALLYFLTLFFLPLAGLKLSLRYGPIFSSIILFFLPSFFLGIISPYAIKLQKGLNPKEGIGTVTGKVFFWSTFGSIIGSLMTGFILIPTFGIKEILILTSLTLLLTGGLPTAIFTYKKKWLTGTLILALASAGLLLIYKSPTHSSAIVYNKDGLYEKIMILDTRIDFKTNNNISRWRARRGSQTELAFQYEAWDEGETESAKIERPVRLLLQDKNTSGGIFLDGNEDHVFDFTKYFSLYKVVRPETKSILVIGGGPYIIPNLLLKDNKDALVDVVEIEPVLLPLAQKYFGLVPNSRLKNYVEDGRRFLLKSDNKYDLIFADAYLSFYSIPVHLTTKEFFQLAKEKLSEDGIFMANMIGGLSTEASPLTFWQIKTFKQVFPESLFFAVASPNSEKTQNLIFVGFRSYSGSAKIASRITDLRKHLINIDKYDFKDSKILTDNYAPVEFLFSKRIE